MQHKTRKTAVSVSASSVSAAPPAVGVTVAPLALNLNDAARAVGVPAFTLRENIGNGSLAAKKAGRHYIIKVADLQRWINGLANVGTTPCFVRRAEARKEASA